VASLIHARVVVDNTVAAQLQRSTHLKISQGFSWKYFSASRFHSLCQKTFLQVFCSTFFSYNQLMKCSSSMANPVSSTVRKTLHAQRMSDKCNGGGIIWPRTVFSFLVLNKLHVILYLSFVWSSACHSRLTFWTYTASYTGHGLTVNVISVGKLVLQLHTLCLEKKDRRYFGRNFDKFTQLFIMFSMNHPDNPCDWKILKCHINRAPICTTLYVMMT